MNKAKLKKLVKTWEDNVEYIEEQLEEGKKAPLKKLRYSEGDVMWEKDKIKRGKRKLDSLD